MKRLLGAGLSVLFAGACGGSAFTSGSSGSIDASDLEGGSSGVEASAGDDASHRGDSAGNRDAQPPATEAAPDAPAALDAGEDVALVVDAAPPHDAHADAACSIPTEPIVITNLCDSTTEFPAACACTPTCACLLTQAICYPTTQYAMAPTSCTDQTSAFRVTCAPFP